MNFKFLLVLCLLVFVLGCKSEPTIVISIDTEFPLGIGFPDSFTEEQKLALTPNEIQWEKALNRINELGFKHNVRFQFNVVGMTAELDPDLISNLSKNHDIACHSYSHKKLPEQPSDKALAELKRCKTTLERITGKEIKGNRFPYTNYTEALFRDLKDLGYEWDSSVWQARDLLFPSHYQGLTEYPLASIDDWTYFIDQGNNDPNEFFLTLEKDISQLSQEHVYVVVLHDWIFADESKIDALEKFISRHKNIKSIDEINSKI